MEGDPKEDYLDVITHPPTFQKPIEFQVLLPSPGVVPPGTVMTIKNDGPSQITTITAASPFRFYDIKTDKFVDINDNVRLGDGQLAARYYNAWKQTQEEKLGVTPAPAGERPDRSGQPVRKILFVEEES